MLRYTVRETRVGLLSSYQVFDNWAKAGRGGHRTNRALVQRHADALNAQMAARRAEANAWASRVLVPVVNEAVGR